MGSDLPEWALREARTELCICAPGGMLPDRVERHDYDCPAANDSVVEDIAIALEHAHDLGVREERERAVGVCRDRAIVYDVRHRRNRQETTRAAAEEARLCADAIATPGTDTEEGGSGGS